MTAKISPLIGDVNLSTTYPHWISSPLLIPWDGRDTARCGFGISGIGAYYPYDGIYSGLSQRPALQKNQTFITRVMMQYCMQRITFNNKI